MELYRFKKMQRDERCIHAVTTKDQTGTYEGSLALHTGQEYSCIVQNRKQAASLLGVAGQYRFVTADQMHGSHIEVITEKKDRGWESAEGAVPECDALITNVKGVILAILTADCVPILLYDPKREAVGAVHAGWRGTHAEITFKTVQKMKEAFGSNPEEIIAGIAPSIGRCCYEIGEEVARFFWMQPEVLEKRGQSYRLDLPLANKIQLLAAGLTEENIEMSGICTACETKRFFSYRKEKGCAGRFMSMIGLKQKS